MSVTSRMFWNIPHASTSISAPASHSTSRGVTKGERQVLTVVMPTLYATSPLHRKLMRLLLTPPGLQPTSMMPAVMNASRWKSLASIHAVMGMMVYCARVPMRMSVGRDSRMRKSCVESVHPMVSMISPRMTEARCPCCTHAKVLGTRKAMIAMMMMKRLVYRDRHWLRESSSVIMCFLFAKVRKTEIIRQEILYFKVSQMSFSTLDSVLFLYLR